MFSERTIIIQCSFHIPVTPFSCFALSNTHTSVIFRFAIPQRTILQYPWGISSDFSATICTHGKVAIIRTFQSER